MVGLLAVRIALPASSDIERNWQLHTDDEVKVAFRCPREWKHAQAYQDRTYLEGFDEHGSYLGHVQFLASEGDTPEQVCRGNAAHKLRPYGEHPQIRSLKIQGQRACLVWPSAEQGQSRIGKNADALLVVEYPRAIKINGFFYGELMMEADKNHILQIGRTIRFLPVGDPGRQDKPAK